MFKLVESQKSKVESLKAKSNFIFCLLLFAYCLLPTALNAQCAMCRASLESEGNVQKAEAVNDGIVYLMAIPYILAAIIGFVIYKMYQGKKIIQISENIIP